MQKKNVYLVDLASGSNMNLLPLAIGMIGSYCSELSDISSEYSIHYRYMRQTGQQLANSFAKPEVVGFSCYVWNFRGSLAAAKIIKMIFPDTNIVLGGFSIPRDQVRIKEFFKQHPYISAIVHGEGEFVFANYLRELAGNQKFSKINGLSVNINNNSSEMIINQEVQRITDLDALPSPFLNGVFDNLLDIYGSRITGVLWETNRGCPYSCTFCDWGNSGVNKLKKYSMSRLYEELSWISRNDFYYMFVSDANFGILKDRDLEIAGWIADFREKNKSPCHMVVNWTKNSGESIVDIADRLSLGGVACNVTLSIQSAHPETLHAIKRKNLTDQQIYQLKQKYHDKFIPTYMEIILGLPLETLDTFKVGLESILTYRNEDRFFVYLCQLLTNTELESQESREKYSIQSRLCKHSVSNRKFDWTDENIEYEEFIVGTSTMSIDDWGQGYLVGYLLTVLHNHRIAFFVMNYLHHQFSLSRIDFIEYIIKLCTDNGHQYPVTNSAISHIDNQRQMMIDSISTMSPLPGAEELIVLPHVGALVLLASKSDKFFNELEKIVVSFCQVHNVQLDNEVLCDVMQYQKMRFPSWPLPPLESRKFSTNIPLYFDALLANSSIPQIIKQNLVVNTIPSHYSYESYSDYAATIVRGGLAVDLLDIEIVDTCKGSDEIVKSYKNVRQEIERRNTKKLMSEYEKVTVTDK